MDRNTVIGVTLILGILLVWQYFSAPSAETIEAERRIQDSIARVEFVADSLNQVAMNADKAMDSDTTAANEQDSILTQKLSGQFGPFAAAAKGVEHTYKLENDLMTVEISNKGGRIKSVTLKEHFKVLEDEAGNQTKVPLKLLEDNKNEFSYTIPVGGAAGGLVKTEDLYFEAEQQANTLVLKANAGPGQFFEQKYSLADGNYLLDYDIRMKGFGNETDNTKIKLHWKNYLDKLEINSQYEMRYSSVYYKEIEKDPDYCSCTADDEELIEKSLKWTSHSNQFFNSTLLADKSFDSGDFETVMLGEDDEDLKLLESNLVLGLEGSNPFEMSMYVGPNEFERLRAIGYDAEDIVPFGWSIFGTINRWIIRPIFSFLSQFVGSAGIVILLLTFIVKGALYPLTYRMIYSQSKMAALKPELAKLKDKYKDDSQQVQVETMKMYREFGVNPLGGCLPVVLQMPIWFALYRFFPASIEFRQVSFLWATDLSSYDVFARLPFEIPFYGTHVSMFTLIWVVTTIIYTYYNSKLMDYSANPMMKYMQFAMPVFFIFFFNNFASGLTAYLAFSNILNIAQTLITKNVIIDQDKILAELHKNKAKPKKKSAFQERLEAAMREQQKIQADKKKK
ncbi:MAG: membrane protein insertase YidC [Saprospiraceae bacterium]|nr:membrane protein insertase YidC [Saprospiraceae bacterium]